MFTKTHIDLGILRVGREITFAFPYDDQLKMITSVTSPCDCSNVYNDVAGRQVAVRFKPKPIPKHLTQANINHYTFTKVINVAYSGPQGIEYKQALSFSGTVKP